MADTSFPPSTQRSNSMMDTEATTPAERVASDVRAASKALEGACALMPTGRTATTEQVSAYVRELQHVDRLLGETVRTAREAGMGAEAEGLGRRRAAVGAAVARRATLAARHLGTRYDESFATLNAMFELGTVPDPRLDGKYRGQVLTTTLLRPFDTAVRALATVYMPWKGKIFDSARDKGVNRVTQSMLVWGRILWPLYGGWHKESPGVYLGMEFDTYNGPGVQDPEVTTLKLDYDIPENPTFLVRSVLDEVVQLTGDYYLGKAYLWRAGEYRLAGFFALRGEA
jgi:hypothetical protein